MAYLKYYSVEHEKLSEAYAKKFNSVEECEIVFDKLLRHFKLASWTKLYFTSGRNHSTAYSHSIIINQDNMLNYGTLCHELAHVYQKQRTKGGYETWHNKFHSKITKRMIHYCNKKKWFEEEIKRRTHPKVIIEPTKEEMKQKEIEKLQIKIKKYEKKIKMYQNKLKKANSSLKRKIKTNLI